MSILPSLSSRLSPLLRSATWRLGVAAVLSLLLLLLWRWALHGAGS